MKPDVYIIKVGSVEEKYLKKIGIKKYNLQEVRNTFSQSYYYGEIVGYRVKGLENVKDFCVKLLNYMKNKEQLTGDEIKVKNRLDKTIKAINKRAISDSNIKENREKTANVVEEYFLALFPNAKESEKTDFFDTLKKTTVKSMDDLEKIFIEIFGAKITGWKSARKDFLQLKNEMKINT